jgi:hypothetical protein
LLDAFERVAAAVMADVILHAPQEHERGHKEKGAAPGCSTRRISLRPALSLSRCSDYVEPQTRSNELSSHGDAQLRLVLRPLIPGRQKVERFSRDVNPRHLQTSEHFRDRGAAANVEYPSGCSPAKPARVRRLARYRGARNSRLFCAAQQTTRAPRPDTRSRLCMSCGNGSLMILELLLIKCDQPQKSLVKFID